MTQVDARRQLRLTCGLPTEMHRDPGWVLLSERFGARRFLLRQLWLGSFGQLVELRISSLAMVFEYQVVLQLTFALDLVLQLPHQDAKWTFEPFWVLGPSRPCV